MTVVTVVTVVRVVRVVTKTLFSQTKLCSLTKLLSSKTFLQFFFFAKQQTVTQLKNSYCDKTKKTQVVTKLKNIYCDKVKNNLWQNPKTKIKKSNCEK